MSLAFPIERPLTRAIGSSVRWGRRPTDPLRDRMAVLVDPNDGLALQAPTGETWVQWITVTNND